MSGYFGRGQVLHPVDDVDLCWSLELEGYFDGDTLDDIKVYKTVSGYRIEVTNLLSDDEIALLTQHWFENRDDGLGDYLYEKWRDEQL